MNQFIIPFSFIVLIGTSCSTNRQVKLPSLNTNTDFYKKVVNVGHQIANAAYEVGDTAGLKVLIHSISKNDSVKVDWTIILRDLHYAINIHKTPMVNLFKMRKYENYIGQTEQSKIDNYTIIKANQEVLSLMADGILRYDISLRSFSIRNFNSIFELLYYANLTKDQKIADIGSGLTTLGIIAGIFYPECTIYNTELDSNLLSYGKARLNTYKDLLNNENYHFILGDSTSTNIQEKVDILFIRKTLHHFTYANIMLQSIKHNLEKNGRVLIYEALPRIKHNNPDCKKLMKKKAILKLLKRNEFQLEKKRISKKYVYLVYKINALEDIKS